MGNFSKYENIKSVLLTPFLANSYALDMGLRSQTIYSFDTHKFQSIVFFNYIDLLYNTSCLNKSHFIGYRIQLT